MRMRLANASSGMRFVWFHVCWMPCVLFFIFRRRLVCKWCRIGPCCSDWTMFYKMSCNRLWMKIITRAEEENGWLMHNSFTSGPRRSNNIRNFKALPRDTWGETPCINITPVNWSCVLCADAFRIATCSDSICRVCIRTHRITPIRTYGILALFRYFEYNLYPTQKFCLSASVKFVS